MGQQSSKSGSKSGSKKTPSKSTAVVKGMPSGYMTSNQLRPGTVNSAPAPSAKSTRKKKGGKCKRKCCKSRTKRR